MPKSKVKERKRPQWVWVPPPTYVQCGCGGRYIQCGTPQGAKSYRSHIAAKRHMDWETPGWDHGWPN